ncbi:MAG: four helix bundle protein [Bacteroidales bacterium]|nr:four helix bundle protein [Bacteroidales bacterium]
MPHKKLKAWKKSIDFVTDVYDITKVFPRGELFGLTQQMRRSAVSIPSNIAEGCSRKNDTETIQFLYIAIASLSELETQLIIANRVGYISEQKIKKMLADIDEIKRVLVGLIKAFKNKINK